MHTCVKKKEKENLTDKLRNITRVLEGEEKKLEDNKKKRGKTQENIDKLNTERIRIQKDLDATVRETNKNDT